MHAVVQTDDRCSADFRGLHWQLPELCILTWNHLCAWWQSIDAAFVHPHKLICTSSFPFDINWVCMVFWGNVLQNPYSIDKCFNLFQNVLLKARSTASWEYTPDKLDCWHAVVYSVCKIYHRTCVQSNASLIMTLQSAPQDTLILP